HARVPSLTPPLLCRIPVADYLQLALRPHPLRYGDADAAVQLECHLLPGLDPYLLRPHHALASTIHGLHGHLILPRRHHHHALIAIGRAPCREGSPVPDFLTSPQRTHPMRHL